MRRLLLALTTVGLVVVLALGWLGWTYHAYQKAAPVLSTREAKLFATKFIPVPAKETRRVNLGYGMVSLPASVIGNPTTLGTGDNAIDIGADSPVQFHAPGEAIDVTDVMQKLNGTPTGNWFELQKQVLATQPFSFWEMLKMGSKQTLTTLELLMIKASMVVGTATDVQIAEADGVGGIVKIIDKPEIGVMVEICDLKHSTMQVVLIDQAMMGNWREIVSTLLSDYSMPLADYSEAAIKRLIDEAHIPPSPPRATTEPAALIPAR